MVSIFFFEFCSYEVYSNTNMALYKDLVPTLRNHIENTVKKIETPEEYELKRADDIIRTNVNKMAKDHLSKITFDMSPVLQTAGKKICPLWIENLRKDLSGNDYKISMKYLPERTEYNEIKVLATARAPWDPETEIKKEHIQRKHHFYGRSKRYKTYILIFSKKDRNPIFFFLNFIYLL